MSTKSAEVPNTPWTALDRYVREWMDGAEVIGEDASDMEGTVTLTERDKWMRDDLINGILSDDEFVQRVAAVDRFSRVRRRSEGCCETCGHKNGGHWGQRCEELVDCVTGEPVEPMKRTYGALHRFEYLKRFDPPAVHIEIVR
jgi:hypothetical protein